MVLLSAVLRGGLAHRVAWFVKDCPRATIRGTFGRGGSSIVGVTIATPDEPQVEEDEAARSWLQDAVQELLRIEPCADGEPEGAAG